MAGIPFGHRLFNCSSCVKCVKCGKHPWNKGEAKGPVTELFGYICMEMLDGDRVFFMDEPSIGCEMLEPTEEALEEYNNEIKENS